MITKFKLHRLFTTLLILAMCSCSKNMSKPASNESTGELAPPQNFKSIITSSNFDWSTSKKVSLTVQGLAVDQNDLNTLIIKLSDGSIVFQYAMSVNESFISDFIVPTSVNNVVITYGAISKTVTIIDNKVNFDFVTPTPQEYN